MLVDKWEIVNLFFFNIYQSIQWFLIICLIRFLFVCLFGCLSVCSIYIVTAERQIPVYPLEWNCLSSLLCWYVYLFPLMLTSYLLYCLYTPSDQYLIFSGALCSWFSPVFILSLSMYVCFTDLSVFVVKEANLLRLLLFNRMLLIRDTKQLYYSFLLGKIKCWGKKI